MKTFIYQTVFLLIVCSAVTESYGQGGGGGGGGGSGGSGGGASGSGGSGSAGGTGGAVGGAAGGSGASGGGGTATSSGQGAAGGAVNRGSSNTRGAQGGNSNTAAPASGAASSPTGSTAGTGGGTNPQGINSPRGIPATANPQLGVEGNTGLPGSAPLTGTAAGGHGGNPPADGGGDTTVIEQNGGVAEPGFFGVNYHPGEDVNKLPSIGWGGQTGIGANARKIAVEDSRHAKFLLSNAYSWTPEGRARLKNWRYEYRDGQWWYWMPGKYWLVHDGLAWRSATGILPDPLVIGDPSGEIREIAERHANGRSATRK